MLDFLKKKSSFEQGFLTCVTDRHSHILPGVDDGIRSMEDSLKVLEYEESLGVRDVWCTPHVMEDVPNRTEDLKSRFDELQNAYKGPLKLHLAAEYMMDSLFEKRLAEKDILVGDDGFLLVETSTMYAPVNLHNLLQNVMNAGYIPLFAHPERYRYLSMDDYGRLHKMGVRFQLNYPSLTGFYGETSHKKALYILKHGWYSATGSDCHSLNAMKSQCTRKILYSELQLFMACAR
ncbi:MAG: tyrosine-protein phosphatase [Candidatus Cryptobacteroides sp.]